MRRAQVIGRLRAAGSPANVAGKARYGIDVRGALGVPMPVIRALAKEIGTDPALAGELWDTGIPECRLLAPMIADPGQADEALLDRWVADLTSWDVCDGFCADLAAWHATAWAKARAWSKRDEEFVRRAGFVLMARLAVSDKKAADAKFLPFVKLVERSPDDARPMVKKAKSWALRQIGKRSEPLRQEVLACARRMARHDTPAARWVASDVLRELQDAAQVRRIAARTARRSAAAK